MEKKLLAAFTLSMFSGAIAAAPSFEGLDVNKDGTLDRDEYAVQSAKQGVQGQPSGNLPSFTILDLDKDGYVSREEALGVQGLSGDNFDKADPNKDGKISSAEYQTLTGTSDSTMMGASQPPAMTGAQGVGSQAMQGGQTTPDSQAMPGGQTPAVPRPVIMHSFQQVDTDNNGTLSRDEMSKVAILAGDFDQADADKDGKVTMNEYKDFIKAAHGEQNNQAESQGIPGVNVTQLITIDKDTAQDISTFASLDADKDGYLSKDEVDRVTNLLNQAMSQGSAQNQGKLSLKDYVTFVQQRHAGGQTIQGTAHGQGQASGSTTEQGKSSTPSMTTP